MTKLTSDIYSNISQSVVASTSHYMLQDLLVLFIMLNISNMSLGFIPATDSGAVKNPDCGCQLLTFKDYTDMMWTTLAEFPGKIFKIFVAVILLVQGWGWISAGGYNGGIQREKF